MKPIQVSVVANGSVHHERTADFTPSQYARAVTKDGPQEQEVRRRGRPPSRGVRGRGGGGRGRGRGRRGGKKRRDDEVEASDEEDTPARPDSDGVEGYSDSKSDLKQ